jgi:hypothetical protein
MNTKPAEHVFKLFLKTFKYKAITMPWKTVYVLKDELNNKGLLAHEQIHINQIERLGSLKFISLYLWYNLKYGYYNNPLEIEARTLSGYS